MILDQAAQRPDGAVLPLPEEIDRLGRSRAIVLKSLLDRDLIECIAADATATAGSPSGAFRVTPAGRRALLAIKRE